MLVYVLSSVLFLGSISVCFCVCSKRKKEPRTVQLWTPRSLESIESEVQEILGPAYRLQPYSKESKESKESRSPKNPIYTVYLFQETRGTTLLTCPLWICYYATSEQTCVLIDRRLPHTPKHPFAQYTAAVPRPV
jgi:hypothetical protein